MKASLVFATSEKETLNGYPLYVRLAHLKIRRKKCIAHCFLQDWDFEKELPYKHHPDYYEVLPLVMEYKAKIKKINFGNYNFQEAKKLLFGASSGSNLNFYNAGVKIPALKKNASLYESALKKFTSYYPNITTAEITPEMAKKFMQHILQDQTPNGVHTYMRTLSAVFSKLSDADNPFKGVRPRKVKTKQKNLTDADLKKLIFTSTYVSKFDSANDNVSINTYKYYWLLMFYLGGIDFIDLASLRYDKHVVDGRLQFYRHKGGTNTFINNLIPPQALQLLKLFKCYPYLVPIYQYTNYEAARENMNKRFYKRVADLQLTQKPLTKSARYTFINRARQLMIDERICIEIVGHEQQNTHSIYTDEYPLHVRDAAHLKIINEQIFYCELPILKTR